MNDTLAIEAKLRRTALRRRLQRAWDGLWRGLLVGAVIYLVALVVFKLAPVPAWLPTSGAIAGGLAVLAGMVAGAWRATTLPETARWVDVQQGLKERLSTALEVGQSETQGEWRELVLADASAHAEKLDPRKLVSFRFSKAGRWALLLLVACVGLGFIPEYRTKDYRNREADAKNIQDAGRKLAELTKQNLEKRKPASESVEKSVAEVGRLGETLAVKPMTRSDALRELAKIADQMKDQLKDFQKDPGLKRLDQANRSNAGQTAQSMADLQRKMEALRKQMGDKAADNPDQLEKMKDQLAKLEQAAKDLASKSGQEADAAKQQLAQSLQSLSQQAAEMGLKMDSLDEAMKALENMQTDMFLKDLQAAMGDMEKLNELAQQMKNMQAQAERLGKDLAEQLKFGQAEMAANRLQKMVEQLKSGKLSQEEMEKLLEEVSKAINPASPYGKVAEHLKDAAKQMQNGQKPQAAESLAQAAKELQDLMKQFGDCESMMATLEALKQAGQCIGSGQKWGLCGNCQGKGCSECNGRGWGKGGKGGQGVGTWADNDGANEWDGNLTKPLEDPGNDPRDQDARGLADRGEGKVRDDLTPSKVQGKFSPGGQMPSVTLKGVSIKGTSKLQYEEALTAAQSDAQSALSQDKVPRAYKDKVRDYFDDVKK